MRAVFDSVAPRYDLMNDLMSARHPSAVEGRYGRAGSSRAPGSGCSMSPAAPAISRCRALPALGAAGGVVVCDVNPSMLEIGRVRALDDGILAGIEWLSSATPRACRFADRSFDLYTIAFGLRNVTRLEPRAGRGAARAEAGRPVHVPRIHPGGRPALAAALRPLQLPRAAAAGPGRDRRPRRLHLSRREYSALPAAGGAGAR